MHLNLIRRHIPYEHYFTPMTKLIALASGLWGVAPTWRHLFWFFGPFKKITIAQF